jgi:hypothetical protein
MQRLLALFVFLIGTVAFAQESTIKMPPATPVTPNTTTSAKMDEVKKPDAMGLKFGAGGQSVTTYRGALLAVGGAFTPTMSLQYKNITFAGMGATYLMKIDRLNMSFGATYFNDDMMDHSSSFRKQRPETYEAWTQVHSFFDEERGKVFAGVYQDVRATWGQYLNVGSSYTLAKHYTFGLSVGGGPVSTNRFTYGPLADAGLGHADPSFTYSNNILPKNGTLVTSLTRPFILQNQNRQAGFVRSTDRPIVWMLSGFWML